MASPDEPDTVVVHTDGACRGNPGPGGWAAILRWRDHERELTGGEARTTNNRMELLAAIAALEALSRPMRVALYTDSEYLRLGVTEWLPAWRARGWRTAGRQPVKNRDLWERLDAARARHEVDWHWVRGHSTDPLNERVDKLARAMSRAQATAGDGPAGKS
jgi:ribonuclease HI